MGVEREVSLKDVYQFIDQTRRELNGSINNTKSELNSSIQSLERKFMALEEGRLSAVEKDLANVIAKQSNTDGKLTVAAAVIATVISSIFTLLNIFIKK